MYTYLLLLLGTIIFPLSYSFESKIAFYKRWTSLFIAISIVALFFIVWDIYFTNLGVWSFNPDYVVGIYLYSLPLEECLFFVLVPYSCIFIYDALNYFIQKDYLKIYSRWITLFLVIALVVLALIYREQAYTFFTFIVAASFLGFHFVVYKDKFLGRFYLAYLVHLIPFFIVNGILTAYPVVIYNPNENLGIRIGTVPVEDSIYSMLLLLMNITIYEYLNSKEFFVKEKSVKTKIINS
jgi:lycopene cyclase domain-containing protein